MKEELEELEKLQRSLFTYILHICMAFSMQNLCAEAKKWLEHFLQSLIYLDVMQLEFSLQPQLFRKYFNIYILKSIEAWNFPSFNLFSFSSKMMFNNQHPLIVASKNNSTIASKSSRYSKNPNFKKIVKETLLGMKFSSYIQLIIQQSRDLRIFFSLQRYS